MNNTITARVIRALDTEVESTGWRSLLLGQKIISDTSNKIKNRKKTVGTIPKWNIKIVERDKIDTLTHKYMTAHFLGFLWPQNLSSWWNDATEPLVIYSISIVGFTVNIRQWKTCFIRNVRETRRGNQE